MGGRFHPESVATLFRNGWQVCAGICSRKVSVKYDTIEELFMAFLDGINSSLIKELTLDEIKSSSEIKLQIDFEKLYYNMLEPKADYLYTLPQWKNILSEESIKDIAKKQKRSKTIVKDEKIGRNNPYPCGGGKKYKKCCGKK